MATQEAAPNTSEVVVVCLYPDFCKKDGRVVAYDIVAISGADQACSANVRVTGSWASNEGARLPKVQNNAPATAGVKSGVVEGHARPAENLAKKVLVNGKPCVRHGTEFHMNCNGPEGPPNTRGKVVYDRGGPAQSKEGILSTLFPLMAGDKDAIARRRAAAAARIEAKMKKDFADPATQHLQTGVNFFRGFVPEVADDVASTARLAFGTARYAADFVLLGRIGDALGFKHPLVPSHYRAMRTTKEISSTVETIYNDPGLLWRGQVSDIKALYQQGEYAQAAGKGAAKILTSLPGGKGWTRVVKVGKIDFKDVQRRVQDGAKEAAEVAADAKKESEKKSAPNGGVIVHPKK